MPPKRKAGAKAAPVKAAPAREPSPPPTVISSRGKEYETTAAAGRPKRTTSGPADTEPPAKKTRTAAKAKAPAKAVPKVTGKGKAKPAAAHIEEAEEEVQEDEDVPETPAPKARARQLNSVAVEDDAIEEAVEVPKRGRGRPPKTVVTSKAEPTKEAGSRKGRGKAAAAPAESNEEEEDEEEEEEEEVEIAQPPSKKPVRPVKAKAAQVEASPKAQQDELEIAELPTNKRGRSTKDNPVVSPAGTDTVATAPVPAKRTGKKRGRPVKAKAVPAETEPEVEEREEAEVAEPPAKKPRGRAVAVPADEIAPPKRRGQAPKGGETTKIDTDDAAAADQLEEELVDEAAAVMDAEKGKAAPKAGKGRGEGKAAVAAVEVVDEEEGDAKAAVGKTAKGRGKAKAISEGEADAQNAAGAVLPEPSSTGKRYWLMKAEQVDRVEKNHKGEDVNVKFTIDDLEAKNKPEPWDGVRNPQIMNFFKAMQVGDEAFFYGSNGKQPGITGIMEIVKEAEPDPSAFDESSPYYKGGDPENPKWLMVHVAHRRTLANKVTLKELQEYKQEGSALQDLKLFKQGRLSVVPVAEKEWNFIMENLATFGEEETAKTNGMAAAKTINGESSAVAGAEDTIDDEQKVIGNTGELPTGSNDGLGDMFNFDPPAGADTSPTVYSELPTTDTLRASETATSSLLPAPVSSRPASRAGSRAASRVASRATSIEPAPRTTVETIKTTVTDIIETISSRPGSAGSLAPPQRARSRGRSKTPGARASRGGSAQPPPNMAALAEEDEAVFDESAVTPADLDAIME